MYWCHVSPRTFQNILDESQILPSEEDNRSDKLSEENYCSCTSRPDKEFLSCFSINRDYLRLGYSYQTFCNPFFWPKIIYPHSLPLESWV